MSGVLVGAISDAGHQELTLKAPPYSVVNTLGFPPAAACKFGISV